MVDRPFLASHDEPCLIGNRSKGMSCPIRRALLMVTISAVIFSLAFTVMLFLVSKPNNGIVGVSGNDSFYHLKMSELLPEVGLVDTFPWLRFCYFREDGNEFVSHHYGFHALLYPFVAASKWMTGDSLAGGRWAVSTFFGLFVCLFYWILRTKHVPLAWLWLLVILILPHQFFLRLGYVRAIGPSLVFMLALILLIIKRKPILLGIAAALFNHLYLGAVMYTPVIVGAFAVACVFDHRETREYPWKMILAAVIGWAVGAITYPYFDGMIEFLKLQVFGSGLTPDISVGREWKPYNDIWWFVTALCGPLLLVLAGSIIARLRLGPRLNADELFMLLLNIGFLILTLKARRFIEYWPAFALLSAALISRPVLEALLGFFDRDESDQQQGHRFRRMTTVASIAIPVIILIWKPGAQRVNEARNDSACKFDLPAVAQMMDYLKATSNQGDVIFTTDWDDFPLYFYHNSYNHYVVGLDPKFTEARRPDLWERYVKLTRGQAPATTSLSREDKEGNSFVDRIEVKLSDIRSHFEAQYVITDRDHQKLARQLSRDEELATLVYPKTKYDECRDAPFLVFRINPAPPPSASDSTEPSDKI